MNWIDWCIVLIPLAFVTGMAIYAKRYAKSVVNFLAAGRVGGRYVLCVGDMVTGLSVITLVAGAEKNYQAGMAYGFWGAIGIPLAIFMALTGYCTYRWRQTRCLSVGQFLELRYGSKFFRVFCSVLRVIAEMTTNAMGPAIATNFFIYYLGLPHRVMIFGVGLPCYAIIMFLCLVFAIVFIWPAGRISLLITDCIQGIMSYPIFVIIGGYLLLKFSWSDDVLPSMWNRVQGESFMNPYDVSKLRDFNLFAIIVTWCSMILNRASWCGGDTSSAAKTPHEQKMAGVLGNWRSGFAYSMILLISIFTIIFMTDPKFAVKSSRHNSTSTEVREQLSCRVLEETVADPAKRNKIIAEIRKIPEKSARKMAKYAEEYGKSPEKLAQLRYPDDFRRYQSAMKTYGRTPGGKSNEDIARFDRQVADMKQAVAAAEAAKPVPPELRNTLIYQPLSRSNNFDTDYYNTARENMGDTPEGRLEFQKFRSLYNQMMMPVLVRKMFPVGLVGIFCLLMIMLMISTEDSYLYNSAVGLVQDLILPFFKGRLSSEKHIFYLRLVSVLVAVYFFLAAMVFSQLDYILMFTTIMCALWLGGAGPIMVFGLYSRFGNLAGAWCAILLGSGHSMFGLFMQRNWALTVYPFLERMGWVGGLNKFLIAVSSPFRPWIDWSMDPVKYPLNSYEIYFISMFLSVGGYIVASLLTYKPYNLDKLLHRGIYGDGTEPAREKWTLRNVFRKMIGITPEYTKGDKVIAYFVFYYSIVWSLIILFGGTVLWNLFFPWPDSWWSVRYVFTIGILPVLTGIISTVWFLWGGIRDMKQLFVDLDNRKDDANDNGQVLESDKK